MDRKLWKVLEATFGSKIHEWQESDGVLDVPVDAMQGLSLQQLVVRWEGWE